MKLEKKPMKNSLIKKYEKATELNDRGTKMRLITEEEMTETVKKYEVKENLFILRLQQIIDTHKVQNTPIKTMVEWVRKIEKDFKDV
tara:strand:- start:518 stop:778 length:261 start_codon:yes stop_codon:yes gene_type:complete